MTIHHIIQHWQLMTINSWLSSLGSWLLAFRSCFFARPATPDGLDQEPRAKSQDSRAKKDIATSEYLASVVTVLVLLVSRMIHVLRSRPVWWKIISESDFCIVVDSNLSCLRYSSLMRRVVSHWGLFSLWSTERMHQWFKAALKLPAVVCATEHRLEVCAVADFL